MRQMVWQGGSPCQEETPGVAANSTEEGLFRQESDTVDLTSRLSPIPEFLHLPTQAASCQGCMTRHDTINT